MNEWGLAYPFMLLAGVGIMLWRLYGTRATPHVLWSDLGIVRRVGAHNRYRESLLWYTILFFLTLACAGPYRAYYVDQEKEKVVWIVVSSKEHPKEYFPFLLTIPSGMNVGVAWQGHGIVTLPSPKPVSGAIIRDYENTENLQTFVTKESVVAVFGESTRLAWKEYAPVMMKKGELKGWLNSISPQTTTKEVRIPLYSIPLMGAFIVLTLFIMFSHTKTRQRT